MANDEERLLVLTSDGQLQLFDQQTGAAVLPSLQLRLAQPRRAGRGGNPRWREANPTRMSVTSGGLILLLLSLQDLSLHADHTPP